MTVTLIVVGLLVWMVLAVVLAVIAGRGMRLADRMERGRHRAPVDARALTREREWAVIR